MVRGLKCHRDTSRSFQVSCDNLTLRTAKKNGHNVTTQVDEGGHPRDMSSTLQGGWTINLWMLQLGGKMSLGTNVTVDLKYSGHSVVVQMSPGRSVVVQMSLGRSLGGRSVKVPATPSEYRIFSQISRMWQIPAAGCRLLSMECNTFWRLLGGW
jgi:hypothetical protein